MATNYQVLRLVDCVPGTDGGEGRGGGRKKTSAFSLYATCICLDILNMASPGAKK